MKRIKMLLYGEPGVGKSVFACHAPKPFFICTDGNYEWLEDFGADPNAYIRVSSWSEAKDAFDQSFDGYDTIVVDLLEDLFKWCESEFCTKSKIDHISDIGYGKGYDITRNEFFLELCKLINKDKHIIFITHGIQYVVKDRRGVEHTKYGPSSRIPDKVMDMIEGRVRYCLRCYLKAEDMGNGVMVKRRYLSLVPKENEFGIARGIDEDNVPHDIPLDFDEFAVAIKLYAPEVKEAPKQKVIQPEQPVVKEEVKEEAKVLPVEPLAEVFKDSPIAKKEPETTTNLEDQAPVQADVVIEDDKNAQTVEALENASPKQTETQPEPQPAPQPQSTADRIAAIKAKLAALNANK